MGNPAYFLYKFFKTDFQKKFFACAAIPFFISLIYVIDGSLLPHRTVKDQVVYRFKMKRTSGYYGESTSTVCYKYKTQKNYQFSTLKTIGFKEVEMTLSPLFNTVKTVKSGKKLIQVQSGIYGVNGVLIFAILISMIICALYIVLKKKISENARLNIVFFNFILLLIWGYLFMVFVL